MKQPVCKDCRAHPNPPPKPRPAPHPGPRCATHHRAFVKKTKKANHERTVKQVYGLSDGEYDRLYAQQGGVCAICRRAKGIARRLAVDHNHRTGRVRGLLCGPCNKFVGYLRDDPEAWRRGAEYLERDLNGLQELGNPA